MRSPSIRCNTVKVHWPHTLSHMTYYIDLHTSHSSPLILSTALSDCTLSHLPTIFFLTTPHLTLLSSSIFVTLFFSSPKLLLFSTPLHPHYPLHVLCLYVCLFFSHFLSLPLSLTHTHTISLYLPLSPHFISAIGTIKAHPSAS